MAIKNWVPWKKSEGEVALTEEELRAQVAEKAFASVSGEEKQELQQQEEDVLSESGHFAIHELVESLVESGELESAEKWAISALRMDAGRVEVAAALAEVYFRKRNQARFLGVVSKFVVPNREKLQRVNPERWKSIARMVSVFKAKKKAVGGGTASSS